MGGSAPMFVYSHPDPQFARPSNTGERFLSCLDAPSFLTPSRLYSYVFLLLRILVMTKLTKHPVPSLWSEQPRQVGVPALRSML
jgi:hypothetical protein